MSFQKFKLNCYKVRLAHYNFPPISGFIGIAVSGLARQWINPGIAKQSTKL